MSHDMHWLVSCRVVFVCMRVCADGVQPLSQVLRVCIAAAV